MTNLNGFPYIIWPVGIKLAIILGKWLASVPTESLPVADGVFALLANKDDVGLLGGSKEIAVKTRFHLIVTLLLSKSYYICDSVRETRIPFA
jgi:hypothetical protein